ncbi:hyaluronan mediated motility receptor-like [Chelonus insularis]|uniref:hyaluronan mediated motility receptor-like n=1 Tax=Chelonus insularis TaxID=460826 RepID=UPI00158F3ECC|nr:hyaluronan mediated motility receptor-like [Chelonus insularis]
MSFSKAKIKRFNELKNDVPPPGSYDPKFDIIMKRFVMKKSKSTLESRNHTLNSKENTKKQINISVNDSSIKLHIQTPMKKTSTSDEIEEAIQKLKNHYETRLAEVESSKIALQEQLTDRDSEITRLTATVEELKSSCAIQESFNQSLQIELDQAEAELADRKQELSDLKALIREAAAEMVERRRRFDVTIAENRATVAALCRRLTENDATFMKLQKDGLFQKQIDSNNQRSCRPML